VQLHSTQDGEELLVPLNGSGQVTFTGSKSLAFDKGSELYTSPRTSHRVSTPALSRWCMP
jgi:mannose-6-phosphate isomerase-like protein (cupin superfamily)